MVERAIFISVVVPVYNVEKYIDECINSVVSQGYDNYELILVDDGSTDISGEICDKHANQNPNIKVIHKENQGLSRARNSGIDIAQGDYIIFLDSDDYFEPNLFNDAISQIEKYPELDLICFTHNVFYPDGEKKHIEYNSTDTDRLLSMDEFVQGYIMGANPAWLTGKSMYRRNIIEDSNIRYNPEYFVSEDFAFFISCVSSAQKFMAINKPSFNYRRMREDSLTYRINEKNILCRLKSMADSYDAVGNDVDKRMLKTAAANKFAVVIYLFYVVKNKEGIQEITEYIKSHRYILKNTTGLSITGAKIIWAILGYYNGSRFLRFAVKAAKKIKGSHDIREDIEKRNKNE